MVSYAIDGFNLHQPEIGFRLLEGSTYAAEVSPRRVNIMIPGVHGEIPAWNDPLPPVLLTFNIEINGTDSQDLEVKWNHLRTLCRLGGNQPVTVQRTTEGSTVATYAQLQSMTEPDFFCAVNKVKTVMMFHVPSGRWETITATEQELAIPGGNQNIVFAAESTRPITNAQFRVAGPLASIEIRDNTNDTGFVWGGQFPVQTGRYLIVNCGSYTAWLNEDEEWDTTHQDVSRWLSTSGNGMLSLVPSPSFVIGNHTNDVTVTAFGTAGNTQLYVRGRRTYV